MIKRIILTDYSDIRPAVADVLMDARVMALLSAEKEFDIRLSLNELLVNSIRYSESRSVLVYTLHDNSLCCSVIDRCERGRGFDGNHCLCADVASEHGRGVYLVRSIADELHYNEREGSVYLRISLD